MSSSNQKKHIQLGMSLGKASHILKKRVMFMLVQKLGMDICFRCSCKIETEQELSVEHKIPYLDSDDPSALFFDLDNIAFSHLSCNIRASRKSGLRSEHPSTTSYRNGCRCTECKQAHSESAQSYRKGK